MEGPTDTIHTGMLSVWIESVGMFLHNTLFLTIRGKIKTLLQSCSNTVPMEQHINVACNRLYYT